MWIAKRGGCLKKFVYLGVLVEAKPKIGALQKSAEPLPFLLRHRDPALLAHSSAPGRRAGPRFRAAESGANTGVWRQVCALRRMVLPAWLVLSTIWQLSRCLSMVRWLFRSIPLLQSVAIASGLAYASALYLSNILSWPGNVSVREWWGSELAIRYCAGFVRRGILGQLSWQITGSLGLRSSYALALSMVMAAAVLLVGLWLARQLIRCCGWRVGLLILAAPAGWPVLMVHGGATFRKDPLQILLGILLLWLWRERTAIRSG